MREHEYEPTPGLPEKLPLGEVVIWQGAPDRTMFARHAFHLRGLAVYFGLMIVLRIGFDVSEGATILASLTGSIPLLATATAVVLALAGLGYFMAKTAIYTITNRRLVLRVGLALPMTINIPFSAIGTMALCQRDDQTGDIVISLMPGNRVAWLALWPHCRALKIGNPEPVLRSVRDARSAAQVLARALAVGADQPITAMQEAMIGKASSPSSPLAA